MKRWKAEIIASAACIVGVFVVGVVAPEMAWLGVGLFLASPVLLVLSVIGARKDPDEQKKREELKAAKAAKKAEKQREWALKMKQEREDHTPVAAVVVTAQDKLSTSGGLGGAVVGGLVAGPLGAVVGASAGKKTEVTGQKVTFSVKYASGRTGIETVDVKSKRFKELSALLVK